MNVVILAAGMGKRMKSNLPKVLHTVANQPMLQHVIHTVARIQPHKIIVVLGHQADIVQQSLAHYTDIPLVFAYQHQQLGTGHAVAQALPYLNPDVPTLVLYGDVPLIQATTLQNMIDAVQTHQSPTTCLAILTAMYDKPTGYGRILRTHAENTPQHGHIYAIVEEKDATAEQKNIQEINTGIMLLPTQALARWLPALKNHNAQGEYYLTDVIACAAAESVHILAQQPALGVWETFGVNDKYQLSVTEMHHQAHQAQQLCLQGVHLMDTRRIDVRGELTCDEDVWIDVGCIFIGRVHLGKGVKINAYSIIENSHIDAGTVILPYSHIDGAHIGVQCRIGPYARIRPETQLAQNCHIGNFVEVKKTHMQANSKANHLSYLGDSLIGQHVNIGAGVITCNYDGAHKHQTIIEDDVFVGSDCQLIAPVRLARGATIAAGTTLSKDAPADALTLSKRDTKTIENWLRPQKKAQPHVANIEKSIKNVEPG